MNTLIKALLLAALLSVSNLLLSQDSPQSIYYQAVARDDNGNEFSEEVLNVRINILSGSDVIYTELHSPTTDTFGLFEILIGTGQVEIGSFPAITWNSDNHFLEVELDSGNGYVLVSNSQFLSVPYALHAKTATTALNVDDADADPTNESLTGFEVSGTNLEITESGSTFSVPLEDIATDEDWVVNAGNQTVTNQDFLVGVNTGSPQSTLDVNGSISSAVATIVSDPNETVTSSLGIANSIVLCDVVNGDIVLELPASNQCTGRVYMIKRFDSSNTSFGTNSQNSLIINPMTGETVDNNTSIILDSNDYEQISVVSSGNGWFILSYTTNPD